MSYPVVRDLVVRNCAQAILLLAMAGVIAGPVSAQSSSGTVRGTVLDPSGAVVTGATVKISNSVSHFERTAKTGEQGTFEFNNVQFNNYHVTAAAAGFQSADQDADVRSAVAVQLKFTLSLGAEQTTMTVADAGDLVETDSTAHTDVDRELFDKLPLESSSSSLSSLVTLASPGISADSNGLFHGLGDHASNSFSIDGQPITDQQSKVFSNQLPLEAVQSRDVIDGAPPAEYGDKTSVVVVVTTRSGLGAAAPHGDTNFSYGSFGSTSGSIDFINGNAKLGNFISASTMNTGRFLDPAEFNAFHDRGNQENLFDRFDVKPSQNDTVTLNFGYTRSWFQTPNSYDAQSATAWNGLVVNNNGLGPNGLPVGPQDQRSEIRTFNIAPSWTRILGANTVLTVAGFARRDGYNYYPSGNPFADLTPGLQAQSIGQNRTLTNLGTRATLTYVRGAHNVKGGLTYEDTILTENDRLGVVDPTSNAPCVNPDGNPNSSPLLTNPAACKGIGTANPAFIPLLGCYDLTRTASLPGSDGCPASKGAPYSFYGHANIRQVAAFLQDTINFHHWTFNIGVRQDFYRGITSATQTEPRVGVSYSVKPTSTVLRVSYARTMETPFNENLVLASTGCSNPVINAIESSTVSPCMNTTPLSPGHRNEFHAGIQQAFGRHFVLDGEYIWKYTHKAYDFSILGNSPVTFPIEWKSSKIPGYTLHGTVPAFHGFSAFIVMSSVAARFSGPQVSGIGAGPGGPVVFRIDHDEKFNQTTHLQYQPWKTGPWFSVNWRYDSGQVASQVPCAGGDCNNGPRGTDTIVDVSNLTPDQQFQGGLFCGSVHATPTTPISASGLCPAAQYGSTLLTIPAAGKENTDHNPPRIQSRNLFDAAIGFDNLFHGDKKKWSLRLEAINLTNKVALYNFLSTFSGTHFVTPRSMTAAVGFHF